MGSKKTNAFHIFLSENIDVLLALAIIIVMMFLLVGRFLVTEGTVLFGDFVSTLELRQFLRVHYPLWSNRNSFNYVGSMRLPYLLIFYFPFYIVNAPAEVFFKFVIVSVFVISGFSMYVTARHFLNKRYADRKTVFLCCLISSLFYAFNPWVMDRVQHFFLLVTYSLVPLIFLVSFQVFSEGRVDLKRVLALILLCSIASTSPHSVFFLLFLIISLYAFCLLSNRKQFVPKTKNFLLFAVLYVSVSAFWILSLADYMLFTGSLYPDYILHWDTIRHLSINSNLFNVFRFVALWWPQVSYSFETFPLNILWVFSSVAVLALCFLALVFHKKDRVAVYLSVLGVVLIFLAGGARSPLPSFYEWLCFDAPILASFGWLFRDPDKWILLLPLVYSVLLALTGLGVMRLISRLRKAIFRNVATSAFMLLLFSSTFIYITPSAINYFEGPFKPVKIPSEIYGVNSWLADDSGSYNVLWLPSYAKYGATWVYNGLSGAFELDSSAKPTFDSYSKYPRGYLNYFDRVLLKNRSNYVANYLNPLNVRYIIFHNDSAFMNANSLFQRLQHQRDLELVKHNGNVYVFENKGWSESVFQPYRRVMAVIGGFDKFVSLNALKPLNLSDFSVVFVDQNAADGCENAEAFVLSGDLLSDFLPFFLNESVVIAPFDFSRRHSPAECWSKASLSDLLGGPFHPYLRQFSVECWDFDYDKGVVVTWAVSERLNIPFNVASMGNFSLFARVFESGAGGNITVYLDEKPVGSVDTRSQLNRFVWREISVNLTVGNHVLTLENMEGLNAVNLISVMPEEKALEMKQRFETWLEGKDLLYVFEAESDFFRENAQVSRGYGGEASNGVVVVLGSDSKVYRSFEIVRSGNYSLVVRGRGSMLFKVDETVHENSFQDFGWHFLDPIYLSSGSHEIEVSGLSENLTEFDVLWLWKVSESFDSWDEFTVDGEPARVLSVREVDSTRFIVELDVTKPFMLHFSNAYDPAWAASFDGKTVGSVRVFGVANGFWINAVGRVIVTVEFQPQRWFYIGSAVSSASLSVCILFISYAWWKKKKKLTARLFV